MPTKKTFSQVGVVDLDICGPSIPKLMGVEGSEVVNSQYGWMPLKYTQCTCIDDVICILVIMKVHWPV